MRLLSLVMVMGACATAPREDHARWPHHRERQDGRIDKLEQRIQELETRLHQLETRPGPPAPAAPAAGS